MLGLKNLFRRKGKTQDTTQHTEATSESASPEELYAGRIILSNGFRYVKLDSPILVNYTPSGGKRIKSIRRMLYTKKTFREAFDENAGDGVEIKVTPDRIKFYLSIVCGSEAYRKKCLPKHSKPGETAVLSNEEIGDMLRLDDIVDADAGEPIDPSTLPKQSKI